MIIQSTTKYIPQETPWCMQRKMNVLTGKTTCTNMCIGKNAWINQCCIQTQIAANFK